MQIVQHKSVTELAQDGVLIANICFFLINSRETLKYRKSAHKVCRSICGLYRKTLSIKCKSLIFHNTSWCYAFDTNFRWHRTRIWLLLNIILCVTAVTQMLWAHASLKKVNIFCHLVFVWNNEAVWRSSCFCFVCLFFRLYKYLRKHSAAHCPTDLSVHFKLVSPL